MANVTANDEGEVVLLDVTSGEALTPEEADGLAEALRVGAEHARRIAKENKQRAEAVATVKEKRHDDMF